MTLLLMMQNINIAMPMCNLIEYSDNCFDTAGSLWQFKRDEIQRDVDLAVNNWPSLNTNQILLVILV